MKREYCIATPAGPVTIRSNGQAVTAIRFGGTPAEAEPARTEPAEDAPADLLLRQAAREIGEYFAGTRRDFTFPTAPDGTPFQRSVWAALRTIPYGERRTYGQIAAAIGRPKACRAVGMANNRNPIAIVIPCHRVVGSTGALVGYAAGLDIKESLLALEAGNDPAH